jgi:hypothetical protein
VIGLSSHTEAKTRIYKSTTNLPFVEMMLNMMVVMGILDKVPPELLGHGGYLSSPWGYRGLGYNNLGKRDLVKQYLARRYWGGNTPGLYGPRSASFYQNPMLGFPGSSPFRYRQYRDSYYPGSGGWIPLRPSSCVGGSCLSQLGNSLNGLWIGEDGEMLGIKNDQFLWTDGQDMHMTGLMNVTSDHVVANIDGSDRQISYDYKVQGDELLTKDSSGTIRYFHRYYPTGPRLY